MDWLGFAFAVLLIEITPGPNMAWLVSLTLSDGRRAGLAATIGIALGLAINAALSSFGLSAVLASMPWITRWIGIAAALMMFWLTARGWRESGETSTAAVAVYRPDRDFLAGVGINLLNAKAAIFFVTVVPQFISGPNAHFSEILVLGMISVAVATLVHLTLVLSASHLRNFVSDPHLNQPFRRVLALTMALVGVWFLYGAMR